MGVRRVVVFVGILAMTATAGCHVGLDTWDAMLLSPWPAPQETPADIGLEYETLRIPSTGGNKLAAWYVPAVGGKARATVLIHTGTEGNIGRYLSLLPWAVENEFNALIYDYQGYGASEGKAGFRNFEPDAHAVVDYLLSRPEPSAHHIIHLGASLGSLPAVAIAADRPDSTIGLITYSGFFTDQVGTIWLETFVSPLLAPFGGITDAMWTASLPGFMNPRNAIDRIQVPILAIIPEHDKVVPPDAQMNFFDALHEPKQLYLAFSAHSPRAIEEEPAIGEAILKWARQLPGLLAAD